MSLITPPTASSQPEMWGGIECSHVRVRGEIRDQMTRSGHLHRIEDLDRIAALGIRALRYPLLWEHHHPGPIDWTWADARLGRLRELGIRPIIGFVHHGSGPLPGGLLDPGFVPGLARFARAVAERYPWIDAYTPVNEPATTARFSGLYGLWHPHGSDATCFGRCFLNECLGTRAAMKAIREVNPRAELVQTEDVGKVHSTPALAYQARYENERRWLTFDVLCGRVDPRHLVHAHLLHCGVPEAELASFVDDPCPPDVFGMNYYVTSERLLDERLERYPQTTHGGNGRHAYADVDAVRARAEGLVGAGALLRELWDRYRRPIAITEAQLACTREEQLRWLVEIWEAACAAQRDGIDIRAVTPWALLGSFDWDSLLVRADGRYENGAFDVRSPAPRRTAVASAIEALAGTGGYAHPVLQMPGWWRRPMRLEYPAVAAPATGPGTALAAEPGGVGAPLVILGARGRLGQAFVRVCRIRGLHVVPLTRQQLDVSDGDRVRRTLTQLRPWAVVNCAGHAHIDAAEGASVEYVRNHVVGAENVAAACAAAGARLLTFSSDLVFDGNAGRRYVEPDEPNPLNCYGRAKHEAERRVLRVYPDALVIRSCAFFNPWDENDFVARTLRALAAGRRVRASSVHVISPTYVPDLVNVALDLLIDGEAGLWHLSNDGELSWLEWGRAIATIAGHEPDRLVPVSTAQDLGWIAARPRFSALGSERGLLLGSFEEALRRYFAVMPEQQAEAAA